VSKPRKEAERTVGKGSSRKGSGGKKSSSESPAGSGRGVANKGGRRASAEDPKRHGAAPTAAAAAAAATTTTTSALRPVLRPVGGISLPVASGLAKKLGSPGNRITPRRRLSLPFYGNYCGRGHGDPTGNTPPVDAVDAVCRQHNLCYGLLGDFDRRCDRDLIESMPKAIASTPSPVGKNAGLLALLYFSLAERNLALGATLFKRTRQRTAEE
jgi:hypothetical protein